MRFMFLKLHSASLKMPESGNIVFAKFLLTLSQVLDTLSHDVGIIGGKPFLTFGLTVIFSPHYLCMLVLSSNKKPWEQLVLTRKLSNTLPSSAQWNAVPTAVLVCLL